MNILAIETSCDETSAAIYGDDGLLANEIASQLIHQKYGGVVPELASRAHVRNIMPIIDTALTKASLPKDAISAIAVTYGPGLVGSILVGLNFAKALALAWNKPLIGINHIEGHLFSNFVNENFPEEPFVTLIVSGGHTLLVRVKAPGQYQIMGTTRDDAAGEAFDKVAKMLNLGYPGGPIIDKISQMADASYLRLTRPKMDNKFDFSFSGLKTAVLYYIKKLAPEELEKHRADIAASFQSTAVNFLIDRSFSLLDEIGLKILSVVGGVACNSLLRKRLMERAIKENIRVMVPPPLLCTDNAAMIARAGYFKYQNGKFSPLSISPEPSLAL
ncbi:tRNA (adenosine(37)-N6)-threonylcarbamoyltransferase complex transferase subunit TsaD [candidate division KSB1 bacterium]|nr:tRNA (adenosine(37)-N6)-threonylcarbamoyltransferase complex transferase subunit TsaD [candidate division KSB1 bacterium]